MGDTRHQQHQQEQSGQGLNLPFLCCGALRTVVPLGWSIISGEAAWHEYTVHSYCSALIGNAAAADLCDFTYSGAS